MTIPDIGRLPPLYQLAVAYSRPLDRAIWHSLFALDTHLAKLVSKASEPLLGQVRLAWWRDRLGEDRANWPKGNPQLMLIAQSWEAASSSLVPLVDGWEHLLVEPPIVRTDIEGFAIGRANAMRAVAERIRTGASDRVQCAGERWALADLAAHSSADDERQLILKLAAKAGLQPLKLPRELRPLAILDGMARRSLAAGATPLFSGRSAALTALRLGMFGR